jgi:hypothetical protein
LMDAIVRLGIRLHERLFCVRFSSDLIRSYRLIVCPGWACHLQLFKSYLGMVSVAFQDLSEHTTCKFVRPICRVC